MYDDADLLKIREALVYNLDLFNYIRIHSSGNIFYDEKKFTLFNELSKNIEFEVLRVSLDDEVDRKVLGYDRNYLDSLLFKKAQCVKCDIALTNYLDVYNFKQRLNEFLLSNPSIYKIRLKKLLIGDDDSTKQAMWVKEHSLDDGIISDIIKELGLFETKNGYVSLDGKIVYMPTGDYDNDIVISNGSLEDYSYRKYNVKTLRRKFGE